MNTSMNGKLIAWVSFGDESLLTASDEIGLHFSATYHGDRDEFWIVQTDGRGYETGRHNPRLAESWRWVEPIAPPEQGKQE